MLKIMIIADDLTGAADTGVKFTTGGPVKLINISFAQQDDTNHICHDHHKINLAISTETRNEPPGKIHEALNKAVMLSGGQPPEVLYKKIDSCLRGYIGLELKYLLEHMNYQAALVAPAYPVFKRITKDGIHYLDGRPVSETELSRDPIQPVQDSCLARLLASEHNLPVHKLKLATVRQGSKALLAEIDRLLKAAWPCLFAVDAETDADLDIVAQAGLAAKERLILAGSAGLAEALSRHMFPEAGPGFKASIRQGPLIFFGGSASNALREQLEYLARHSGALIVTLEPDKLLAGEEQPVPALKQGQSLIIKLPRPQEKQVYSSLDLIRAFGRQAARIIEKLKPGAVFLSGGDTARETLEALGISQLWIQAEIKPGTVLLHYNDMAIVTKSGTFGDKSILAEIHEYLSRVQP